MLLVPLLLPFFVLTLPEAISFEDELGSLGSMIKGWQIKTWNNPFLLYAYFLSFHETYFKKLFNA